MSPTTVNSTIWNISTEIAGLAPNDLDFVFPSYRKENPMSFCTKSTAIVVAPVATADTGKIRIGGGCRLPVKAA